MIRRTLVLSSALALAGMLAACNDSSSVMSPRATPSFAKGGGGGTGGGGTPAPSRCASIAVTNNPQEVRNLDMPDIKYNLENCGAETLSLTVTVTEIDGFLSQLCPSPVAPPVTIALAGKQKISGTLPVFRGPCGMTGPVNGTLVQGTNRWQGHNLQITITDAATGVVYGSGFFSWQDAFNPRV